MMPRIFLPLKADASDEIRITGEKARHLITVLRCRVGDSLSLFDGKGTTYKARIKGITGRDVIVEIVHAVEDYAESPLTITLIQGLLKGEKMDLVIQKTTELGIGEIIPAITERSQIRETRKISRWRKIAEEAAEQCGRSAVPVIQDVISYRDLFTRSSPHASRLDKTFGLIFWEEGGNPLPECCSREDTSSSLVIAIGPEGGFTGEEIAMAVAGGFSVASLGRRILRAETAAIAATALVQFLYGDLGGKPSPRKAE